MCRLLFEIGLRGVDAKLYSKALESMVHGGPDAQDFHYYSDKVYMGHNRLSIRELSIEGNQPMTSIDDRFVIIYNGELYNDRQIVSDYLSHKKINASSDTRILVELWAEYGPQCIHWLNGMFAFVIYDKKLRETFYCRDHAGMKPLFLYQNSDRIILSSEISAIKTLVGHLEQDKESIIAYDAFGHMPRPFSGYSDVQMVPKATLFKITSQLNVVQIDSIRLVTDSEEKSLRTLLESALMRHMVSDVQVGLFFSGGIDSSILSILLKNKNTPHLSIGFKDSHIDESAVRQRFITEFNVQGYVNKVLSSEDVDIYSKRAEEVRSIKSIDGINMYIISDIADKSDIRVALSGLGADELFNGYPSTYRLKFLPLLRLIPFKIFFAKILLLINLKKFARIDWLSFNNPIGDYLFLRGMTSLNELKGKWQVSADELSHIFNKVRYNESFTRDSWSYANFLEYEFYMANQLLPDADFFSMQRSIEVRMPFLDKELITQSPKHKNENWSSYGKHALIKAVPELPEYIYNRVKRGFTIR